MSILYVRRPGSGPFGEEPVELAPGTIEMHLPPNLYLSGGATPNHVHHVSKPDQQIAVWLARERCRWCRAGY